MLPFDPIPIALFGMITLIAIGTPIARAFARRLDRTTAAPQLPADVTERLARMEAAIETIAVEVERISEGQRFTTKLLAERASGAPALPARDASPAER